MKVLSKETVSGYNFDVKNKNAPNGTKGAF